MRINTYLYVARGPKTRKVVEKIHINAASTEFWPKFTIQTSILINVYSCHPYLLPVRGMLASYSFDSGRNNLLNKISQNANFATISPQISKQVLCYTFLMCFVGKKSARAFQFGVYSRHISSHMRRIFSKRQHHDCLHRRSAFMNNAVRACDYVISAVKW